jgi:hypothetical protein
MGATLSLNTQYDRGRSFLLPFFVHGDTFFQKHTMTSTCFRDFGLLVERRSTVSGQCFGWKKTPGAVAGHRLSFKESILSEQLAPFFVNGALEK